jgi:proteasome accessory factor C
VAEKRQRTRTVPKTSERLGRMLVVVPYLVQHQGAQLTEVARLFDVPVDQLRRDLNLLFMSGLPPYGPGDLIDVDVDEDGGIWITMADHFARPLRLTRAEALALYLRGTELLSAPGLSGAPALASALKKLRDTLGPDTLGDPAAIQGSAAGTPPQHLEALRGAAAEHQQLRIDYFAASTHAWSTRTIDPEEVFSSMGNWYVAAWDVDQDAERLFRADRVRAASPTGTRFLPRGLEGAGRKLYTPSGGEQTVRLRLAPGARWIAEYYATTDHVELDDGSLEASLPAKQLDWVANLLLRVGSHAEVLDSPQLIDLVKEQARRALQNYGR